MLALYRLAAIGLLLDCVSRLIDVQKRLYVLHVLATHPLPSEFDTNSIALPDSDWNRNAFRGLTPGVTLKQPSRSFSASPDETAPGLGTTASTGATGRSDLPSGETGEGCDSQTLQNLRVVRNKTGWPIAVTSPEAGSPGPALASLATTPRQKPADWDTWGEASKRGWRRAEKMMIQRAGLPAICIPRLGDGQECSEHDHIAGEPAPTRHDACGYIHRPNAECPHLPGWGT